MNHDDARDLITQVFDDLGVPCGWRTLTRTAKGIHCQWINQHRDNQSIEVRLIDGESFDRFKLRAMQYITDAHVRRSSTYGGGINDRQHVS
ncbi:hypothetical protein JDN40_14465 [Rhodomicrobium vannielii ATCC 17100]|uniref:hypothetical protein n=1 Tax=Rhodomicrobium vannielii TaxID=1069 RepID=UPI00191862B2|nr:hypothetical protein [Rhodomicrobium vannielii]MBJ7535312.1 hypothetical protein [Rhodomicrobium vannielii ATCC 17100]